MVERTPLPFHPLFQQLQVDLAHQVDRGSLDVLAHHWVLSLQLGPVDILRLMCNKTCLQLHTKEDIDAVVILRRFRVLVNKSYVFTCFILSSKS